MFYLTFTLLLLAVSSSCDYQSKIINGVISFIDDYPYMVSLQMFGDHFCGGAILDEETILTAAHCMKFVKHIPMRWYFKIQAGSAKLKHGGQTIAVSAIRDHPEYSSKTSDYDIAVLKLSHKLKFNDQVKPVDLPTARVPPGTVANASGWGKTTTVGGLSTKLYSVELPVIDQQICIDSYSEEIFTSRMMCAGYLEGGKDTCQGDSGGPLVANNTVIGVVSWGYGCAQEGRPGVFSDVAQYLEFVHKSR